jgi:hypothetical protein
MSSAMLARKRESAPAPKAKTPSKDAAAGLRIGEPDDSFEREADRAADEVMAGGGPRRDWSLSGISIGGHFQRRTAVPIETNVAPPIVHDVLNSRGQPLDNATRNFFEPRFGHDFGRVRVHTGADAASSSRAIGARAYAIGERIIFGAGQYRPESRNGLHLLAHELAHVVQQSGTGDPGPNDVRVKSSLSGLIQRQPAAAGQQPDSGGGSQPQSAGSLADATTQLTQSAGAPSSLKRLSFEGTLAAGQTLPGSDSDKTIHTLADTHVKLNVTATYFSAGFTPGLIITSGTWPHPDMELTSVSFNFTTGLFGWQATGPNYAWWLGHAKDKLTAGLAGLFGAMPPPMRTPGYNPFSDANIQGNLATFFSSLSSSSAPANSAPAGTPNASGLATSATFTLRGEIRQDSGRMALIVPSGTEVTVRVNLSGGVPKNLKEIRVSSVDLELRGSGGGGSNVAFRLGDADFPLIFISSATFSSGGHLNFSYSLVSEVGETFWRMLLAATAVASGQGDKVGENATASKDPALRAVVDNLIHSDVEPLLRHLIVANRHAIPGIDLGEALGLGSEPGDFPPPKPGASNG